MTEPLLDPALLARLGSLQLSTRRRLAGHLAGDHRSSRFGSSVDFADYREYHPGDDFRRIDYALYARLDLLLLRLFEAEEDVAVRLLVDTSASMAVDGKLRQAARVAAALGFVALTRRDPVSVHTFPLDRPAPRYLGRNAVPQLFAHLGSLTPSGDTPFAAAAAHLLARPGPPGVTVVLSDLLTPEWEAGIRRLPGRGGAVTIVHVLAASDLEPEVTGDVELVDPETGERVPMSLAADVVAQFSRAARQWADDVAGRARQAGAQYLRVFAHDDVESLLLGAWRREGVLR
jgi:uncharacterized protein (DUF58 family)